VPVRTVWHGRPLDLRCFWKNLNQNIP